MFPSDISFSSLLAGACEHSLGLEAYDTNGGIDYNLVKYVTKLI